MGRSHLIPFYNIRKNVATIFVTLEVVVRLVIPVVFYEITNVECVYSSNTTIFIGRI